jgi:hypothetical protein
MVKLGCSDSLWEEDSLIQRVSFFGISLLWKDVFETLYLPCRSSFPAFRIQQSLTQQKYSVFQQVRKIPDAFIVTLQTQLSMPITRSKAPTSTVLTQDLGFESLQGHGSVLLLCFFFVIVVSCVGRGLATADLVSEE